MCKLWEISGLFILFSLLIVNIWSYSLSMSLLLFGLICRGIPSISWILLLSSFNSLSVFIRWNWREAIVDSSSTSLIPLHCILIFRMFWNFLFSGTKIGTYDLHSLLCSLNVLISSLLAWLRMEVLKNSIISMVLKGEFY